MVNFRRTPTEQYFGWNPARYFEEILGDEKSPDRATSAYHNVIVGKYASFKGKLPNLSLLI